MRYVVIGRIPWFDPVGGIAVGVLTILIFPLFCHRLSVVENI